MRRVSMFVLLFAAGCSKEVVESPKTLASGSAPAPSPPSAPASPPAVSAKAVPLSAPMVVCKKLEAAGVATDCQPSGSSDTSARFGQAGSAGSGVVSVFEDDKTFDSISASMAKDKSKKTATSAKARTLVMWTTESADADKKIRAVVAGL